MFDFLKFGKKPDKFKSPEERELYLNDIKDRLSNNYADVQFNFILLPEISTDHRTIVKITYWKKKIGDHVKKHEKLATCEAEKVQIDLNADLNGILVFRAERNKELVMGDTDNYMDLEEFNF